jgi:hypothetical protein
MSLDDFDEDSDVGLDYELNSRYRLYRQIEMEDGGEIRTFYGPYWDNSRKFEGMKDYNSWEQIVKLWAPDARIFAKLPIHEDDVKRVIPGKKPYIVEVCHSLEKIDKPFGYGQSDYWGTFKFKNVGKTEAARLIEKLAEKKCPPNKYNVGMELRIPPEEVARIARERRRSIRQKVLSVLKVEGGRK